MIKIVKSLEDIRKYTWEKIVWAGCVRRNIWSKFDWVPRTLGREHVPLGNPSIGSGGTFCSVLRDHSSLQLSFQFFYIYCGESIYWEWWDILLCFTGSLFFATFFSQFEHQKYIADVKYIELYNRTFGYVLQDSLQNTILHSYPPHTK